MLRPYIPPKGYVYDPITDSEIAVNPEYEWERDIVNHPLARARRALSDARRLETYYRNLAARADNLLHAAKARHWRKKEQDAVAECAAWQKRIDSIMLLRDPAA